jgi:hypothetical protein
LPPVSTTLSNLVEKFAASVIDTSGKFAAGVVNTSGNFATIAKAQMLNIHDIDIKIMNNVSRKRTGLTSL